MSVRVSNRVLCYQISLSSLRTTLRDLIGSLGFSNFCPIVSLFKFENFDTQNRVMKSTEEIRRVWECNFHEEIGALDKCLLLFPIITLDTEFPGFLRNTPRDALEDERYEGVKFNVDTLKLIQLGFTLSDAYGNIGGTWEFNFRGFSEKFDPHVQASIALLKRNGLDFDKIGNSGICVEDFVARFLALLKLHRGLHDLKWVCFHGLYDMAYLLKLLTQKPLPGSVAMFANALGVVFGTIYDVKYMARHCPGLFGGEIGLSRVASILDVERSGDAHQAGSDSLLTAAVFAKMNSMFRPVAGMSEGCMYSISMKIIRQPPRVVIPRPFPCPPFERYLPPMVLAPMIHYPPFHSVASHAFHSATPHAFHSATPHAFHSATPHAFHSMAPHAYSAPIIPLVPAPM